MCHDVAPQDGYIYTYCAILKGATKCIRKYISFGFLSCLLLSTVYYQISKKGHKTTRGKKWFLSSAPDTRAVISLYVNKWMTSRQQLYQASVWSIRLCGCVLYSAMSIRLSHPPLAFTCAQRRGRLYRFPIGGLSSWSLGRDGEDSRLIYSPPPELGSRTRTRWPIWNYLPRISRCASVRLSDVHFNVWVFELMSDAAAHCCRGDWRTGSGLHHISDRLRGLLWHQAVIVWGWMMPRCSLIYGKDTSVKVAPHSPNFWSLKNSYKLSYPMTWGKHNFKKAIFPF